MPVRSRHGLHFSCRGLTRATTEDARHERPVSDVKEGDGGARRQHANGDHTDRHPAAPDVVIDLQGEMVRNSHLAEHA